MSHVLSHPNPNFWLFHEACGILVPQLVMKLEPLAVEVWCLNHWTTREVPLNSTSWWEQCKECVVIFNPHRKKPSFKQQRPGVRKRFLKGWDSKSFRLAGLGSLQSGVWKPNHKQYISKRMWLCSSKTVCKSMRSCMVGFFIFTKTKLYTIVWGPLSKTTAGWNRLLRVKMREESSQMLIPWSSKLIHFLGMAFLKISHPPRKRSQGKSNENFPYCNFGNELKSDHCQT